MTEQAGGNMEKKMQGICRFVLIILAVLCGIKFLLGTHLRENVPCSVSGTVILLVEDRVFCGTGYYARYYIWIASGEEKICFAVRRNEYKMYWIGEDIEFLK